MNSQASKPLRLLILALLVLTGCVSPHRAAPPSAPPSEHVEVVGLQPIFYTVPLAPGAIPAPVSTSTTLAPNAIPPAGGHHFGTFVTQAFPIGPAAGDMTGTYPNPTVAQCSGVSGACSILASNLQFGQSVGSPSLLQQGLTIDAATNTLTIAAQNASTSATSFRTGGQLLLQSGSGANTNGTSGNIEALIAAGSGTGASGTFFANIATHNTFVADNQGVVVGRTDASQMGMRIAPLIAQETIYTGVWNGANATSPNGSNYKFALANTAGTDFWQTNGIQFGNSSNASLIAMAFSGGTTANLSWSSTVSVEPFLTQTQQLNASTPNNFEIDPQIPGAACTASAPCSPGNFVVNVGAIGATGSPTEAGVIFRRNGTNLVQLSADPSGLAYGEITLGNVTNTVGNAALIGNGTANTYLQSAGTGHLSTSTIVDALTWTSSGVQLFSGAAGSVTLAGGAGVLGITNATTAPTSSPTGGDVEWVAGGNTHNFLGTTAQAYTLTFGSSYSLAPANLTTASGTGANATFQAQNETGTTSTGGTAFLQGGSGTSTNGDAAMVDGGGTIFARSVVGSKKVSLGQTGSLYGIRYPSFKSTSTTYTISTGDYIVEVTAAVTVTLPASPTTGDTYVVLCAVASTTCTVAGNSKNINGSASNLSLVSGAAPAFAHSILTYDGTQWITWAGGTGEIDRAPTWRRAANDNGLDPCDERRKAA